MSNKININNVELFLTEPDNLDMSAVGLHDVQQQIEACWLTLEDNELPLVPRLLGRPGVGKTTLAYSVAKKLNKEAFIFQCTMDTRPEDLIITPVIGENKSLKNFFKSGPNIRYQASSLVSAMVKGGVCILDEANRMTEKSWASLAPLFDNRRYVESITAGVKVKAHPDFRCCVTMNDDSSTFEVPEYIMSRLQPQIYVDFPSQTEEREILKVNLPYAEDEVINKMSEFLAHAHQFGEPFSSRDAIHIIRFARRLSQHKKLPLGDALIIAIQKVLGNDAINYLDPDYQPTFNIASDMWDNEFDDPEDFDVD